MSLSGSLGFGTLLALRMKEGGCFEFVGSAIVFSPMGQLALRLEYGHDLIQRVVASECESKIDDLVWWSFLCSTFESLPIHPVPNSTNPTQPLPADTPRKHCFAH